MREAILGTNNNGTNSLYQWKHDTANGYYVEQIGNGLYISRPTAEGSFNATTPNSSLINVVSGQVATIEDLPKQCKHGMVIRVANSESTDNDDYYVKFLVITIETVKGFGKNVQCPAHRLNMIKQQCLFS